VPERRPRSAPDPASTRVTGEASGAGDGGTASPAHVVDGWFTVDPPRLIGTRCTACGTVCFPPQTLTCRNPACENDELVEERLSNRGRIWSYTDARYRPPTFPNTVLEMPNFATDSSVAVKPPARPFRAAIAAAAYEEAGLGPEDLSLAEVYDLSTALELDWYEDIGLCEPGEAERLLRDGVTSLGGRVPVNPSGGLASFGEAIPAQAIAQVCELTWQLRGQAGERQVAGARAGIAVNQGLFGHGSAIIAVT
jgi:hypothetical protein